MESPVMTSASSHRLRSAVSACAQPTHSYLNSSYLSSSIKVESHNSGGCLNKFYESSLPNAAKKSHSSTDYSSLHKRHKGCGRKGFEHHCGPKSDGGEGEVSSNRGVLDLMIGNHFLSRLNLTRHFLDSTKLPDYHDEPNRNKSVTDTSENVIHSKTNSDVIRNGEPLNHHKSKKDTPVSDDCSTPANPHSDIPDTHRLSRWHPKHLLSRRTARILRENRNVWADTVGTSKSVPPETIVSPFQDWQPFPPAPEVSTMLEFAGNTPAFSDFCRIVSEPRKANKVCEEKRPSPPHPRNEENPCRKLSKVMTKYEVFLGGSCNPTTWRTDFAIPELEKMGISYYNPQQVEEWGPELMEVEYEAKENATVVFFVLDNQTRGVSALIEVAHLAGNRRKLILVVQSYTQKKQTICDERISEEEYEDLKTGQEVLRDLVERQGIPVFDDIKVALDRTEKIVKERDFQPTAALLDGENPIGPRDVFRNLDGESSECSLDLTLSEVEASMRNVIEKADRKEKSRSISYEKYRVAGNELYFPEKDMNGSLLDGVKFSSEDRSSLVSKIKKHCEESAFSSSSSFPSLCYTDVYLGGTIENTSWRESIAVPMLKEHCLTFFIPQPSEGRNRFTETEAAAIESCHILLFAITRTARSVAAMAIAGHYIGRGANVVLCVEHLPPNAMIGEEKLSENAVKDYNRGRMYLMDIAERSGVPVFTDIPTAVRFVTQKCKNR